METDLRETPPDIVGASCIGRNVIASLRLPQTTPSRNSAATRKRLRLEERFSRRGWRGIVGETARRRRGEGSAQLQKSDARPRHECSRYLSVRQRRGRMRGEVTELSEFGLLAGLRRAGREQDEWKAIASTAVSLRRYQRRLPHRLYQYYAYSFPRKTCPTGRNCCVCTDRIRLRTDLFADCNHLSPRPRSLCRQNFSPTGTLSNSGILSFHHNDL